MTKQTETVKGILEDNWCNHYNFSELDGAYKVKDIRGYFEECETRLKSLLIGKMTVEMIAPVIQKTIHNGKCECNVCVILATALHQAIEKIVKES